MKYLKKIGFLGAMLIVCAIIACAIVFPIMSKTGSLGKYGIGYALNAAVFAFALLLQLAFVVLSHRIAVGKTQEILFFVSCTVLMSSLIGYGFYCLLRCTFRLKALDWIGFFRDILMGDWKYFGIVFIIWVLFVIFYSNVIDRRILDFVGKGGLRGSGKLKQVDSNLENSRWMNKEEQTRLFKTYRYTKLATVKKDGIPVMAKLTPGDRDLEVAFNSPCHSLIIGSTGSGKTTTFVSPMIQLLGATGAGSSMIMTDPKGELFSLHSGFLTSRGYDVKVIDLRDTYASYRWNPLDAIWDSYEIYRTVHKLTKVRHGDVKESGLKPIGDISSFGEKWYEFDGKAYSAYEPLAFSVKMYRKKIFDEVYEDLNDLVSVLIPVENEKDPMWEKGARSIALAVLLAMLEDSEKPELGMTKEKYNFFNLTKILQNSSNDYEDLRNYFKGRSALSKAKSLSKQVCDAATQTRASYMSIVYEKLTMFNDAGICALTSSSDFSAGVLAERPTALFLKIPDEKDTRHNLAAIFILNIYKTLIKIASAKESLSLDRNVYFIMDEFGNMPKIEKFDKFITVGRSRKIWFNMIIQSYAQLNNVYGDTVADIVKGNCGIKMFIGSNDMNTCKEYSELCGNITVVTTSTSGSIHSSEVNISSQTQVRPLIYPSELQRLNAPGDIGHSIIVTFGNYPLKTYFSPSFKVPFYKTGKMDTGDIAERGFNENEVFYDIRVRNNSMAEAQKQKAAEAEKQTSTSQAEAEPEKTTEETPVQASASEQNPEKGLLDLLREFMTENPNAKVSDLYAVLSAEQEGKPKNGEEGNQEQNKDSEQENGEKEKGDGEQNA